MKVNVIDLKSEERIALIKDLITLENDIRALRQQLELVERTKEILDYRDKVLKENKENGF